MSSISRSSLILQDSEDFQSPVANSPKLQERFPYFTRSVAKQIATFSTSSRYSRERDIALTSLSLDQVNVGRCSITPFKSSLSSSNYNLNRRFLSVSERNINGGNNLRDSQLNQIQQPIMDFPAFRRWSISCTCLLQFFIVTAIIVTVWNVQGYRRETQSLFNKVEGLKSQIDRLKRGDKGGVNQQLETIGKATDQKFAEVERMLQDIKSCPQSDADMDCCSALDEVDGENNVLRPDFALESTGGSIISTGATEQFDLGSTSAWIFGIPICCSRNGPEAVIQADVQPGECWAFKGSCGSVTIGLLGYVFITGVTLYHIPVSISPSGNINSAPKEFSIVGLTNEQNTDGKVFGRFTYDSDGPPAQYFPIDGCSRSYEAIQLYIHSNHGNPVFTCVYRLQVHGKLDEEETMKLGVQ